MTLPGHAENQRLGRYELLRLLSRGGMGEIFLARARGAGGFEKKVVIKRILPYLAEEQEFVQKFIDEANIVTHLTHGNIVPVFDMGEADGGELYIAMEYIAGRDLRDVLKATRSRQAPLPVKACLFVIAEACKGLGYAHHKTDSEGRPLNIIHRDISPSNIMISREGEVKIVDFGIAKARGRLSKSITGRLQGKFCYMSPEQASGFSVDERSDIFSTGVVLYELLTNTRPFEGARDLESLEKVKTYHPPPPSGLIEGIPEEVDAIVMKALEKDKEARYGSVEELERAILTYLYSNGGTTSRDLVSDLKDLYPDGIEHPTARLGVTDSQPQMMTLDDVMDAELDKLLGGDEGTPSIPRPVLRTVDPHTATATASSSTPTMGVPMRDEQGTVSLIIDKPSLARVESQEIRIRVVDEPSTEPALARAEGEPSSPTAQVGLVETGEMPSLEAPGGDDTGPVVAPGTGEVRGLSQPVGTALQSDSGVGLQSSALQGAVSSPTVDVPVRPESGTFEQPRRRWTVVVGVLAAVLAVFGLFQLYQNYVAAPSLVVFTTPPGAQVYVDDEMVGQSGEEPIRLQSPGVKTIVVKMDGFAPSQPRRVKLRRGREKELTFVLQKPSAPAAIKPVSFISSPDGAAVLLNGRFVGKTPVTVDVPTDKAVKITLQSSDESPDKVYAFGAGQELKGSYSHTFVPPVVKDEPDVGAVAEGDAGSGEQVPQDTPGEDDSKYITVSVNSTPPGAAIYMNGRKAGVAPGGVRVREGSRGRLVLKLDGYEDASITLAPNRKLYSANLKKKATPVADPGSDKPKEPPVTVNVGCWDTVRPAPGPTPCSAIVIDGKPSSGGRVKLTPGVHTFSASSHSGLKGSISVRITRDNQPVSIKLYRSP